MRITKELRQSIIRTFLITLVVFIIYGSYILFIGIPLTQRHFQ